MPGLGIPGFAGHASAIAKAGVYDLAIHHEQILVPMLLRHWQIDKLDGLDADGEQARERVMARLAKSERVARRLTERRAEASATARRGLNPRLRQLVVLRLGKRDRRQPGRRCDRRQPVAGSAVGGGGDPDGVRDA